MNQFNSYLQSKINKVKNGMEITKASISRKIEKRIVTVKK